MKENEKNPPTVAVATLGCKVNQCESASFQSGCEERGLTVGPFDRPADIYVINTCAVTARAAAQSRQLIRRARRANPEARVVVTGCYAQIAPEKIREIAAGPVTIVGNANKHQVLDLIGPEQDGGTYFSDIKLQRKISLLPVKRFPGRTRAFLKVQDGCNNFCSYCIVPHARGRSRSLAPELVLAQAARYAEEGHREIVVTGIHVGHYGLDLEPPLSLARLLEKLCAHTPDMRYRLSSLEPTEISDDLIRLMQESANFMDHFHIPLQSGSSAILSRMNRRYSAEQFGDIVSRCRELVPAAAIGVDVLVGFPGETEDDFMKTRELLAGLPVTYLHVFPFSKRPGTPAAGMKNQVPRKIKDGRVAVLRKLDHKKRTAFYESRLGRVHQVLVESERAADGLYKGFTGNYVPVHFAAEEAHVNQGVPVRLEEVRERFVIGKLV